MQTQFLKCAKEEMKSQIQLRKLNVTSFGHHMNFDLFMEFLSLKTFVERQNFRLNDFCLLFVLLVFIGELGIFEIKC